MMEHRPLLLRVIQNDYWAFLSAVFPLVFWFFVGYDRLVARMDVGNVLYIALGVTFCCALLILSLYAGIAALYEHGAPVRAVMYSALVYRERIYLAYIYAFQGQKYLCKHTVMKNKRTARYTPGIELEVLVDTNRPKRAVIKSLYLE